MRKTRNTQGELIAMKKQIIEQCLNRPMKSKDGAKLPLMHEKAFLRLQYRYQKEGESALISKKRPQAIYPQKQDFKAGSGNYQTISHKTS